MKYSNIFLGIAIMTITFFVVQDDIVNLKIKNEGQIVTMKIIDKPVSCLGTKAKWMMKLEYNNKVFIKQVPSIYCEEHHIGEMVKVYHAEGEDNVVLLNENIKGEFYAAGIIAAVGLYVFFYGFKSNKMKI